MADVAALVAKINILEVRTPLPLVDFLPGLERGPAPSAPLARWSRIFLVTGPTVLHHVSRALDPGPSTSSVPKVNLCVWQARVTMDESLLAGNASLVSGVMKTVAEDATGSNIAWIILCGILPAHYAMLSSVKAAAISTKASGSGRGNLRPEITLQTFQTQPEPHAAETCPQ